MRIPIKGLAISSTASRTSGSCLTPMGTQETDFANSSAMNNFIEEAEIRMSEPDRSPNRQLQGAITERSGIGSSFVIRQLVLFAVVFAAISIRAEIPELDTIFYGKIINRTSGQEYLLTQGTLSWMISRPDGSQVPLTTPLAPVGGGIYSYQLRVPHEALAYGLTVSSNAVPLTLQTTTCSHLQISVNGASAAIMAPGSSTFSVSQAARGSTYRLDLELFNTLADAAGDGIPDWWKAKYGIVDPNADPDGDGWSNLQEFLH